MTEDGGRRTEGRGQRADDGGRWAEGGWRKEGVIIIECVLARCVR